jgi:uncharacterized protein (DUF983 family)
LFLWISTTSILAGRLKCPRCGESIWRYRLPLKRCRRCGADLTRTNAKSRS